MTHEVNVLRIRQEGTHVLLIQNGTTLVDMPWDKAIEMAREIIHRARLAEEIERHEFVTLDQAILQRAGAGFGLANNPDILREAMKEAVHNPLLRKHMPSIKSQEIVGAPSVHHA